MPSRLEPLEGLQEIQSQEASAWAVDVANVASSPTSPTLHQVVVENDNTTDIVLIVMPVGSIGVATTIITFPLWAGLTAYIGKVIRIEYSFLDNNSNRVARHIRFKVVL